MRLQFKIYYCMNSHLKFYENSSKKKNLTKLLKVWPGYAFWTEFQVLKILLVYFLNFVHFCVLVSFLWLINVYVTYKNKIKGMCFLQITVYKAWTQSFVWRNWVTPVTRFLSIKKINISWQNFLGKVFF